MYINDCNVGNEINIFFAAAAVVAAGYKFDASV
jgi:hypothetical protein